MDTLPALAYGFQLTAAVVAIVGVVISVSTYRRSQRIRKAEWLKSLFEMFYIANTFKDVRLWIDFDQLPQKLGNDQDHAVEEKFSDFLNFFEFIATLRLEQQLDLICSDGFDEFTDPPGTSEWGGLGPGCNYVTESGTNFPSSVTIRANTGGGTFP